MSAERRVQDLSADRLRWLAARLQQKGRQPGQEAIRPRPAGMAPLPLSFAQERLWFLDQLDGARSPYNVPEAVRLTGRLDLDALRRTLGEIVRRHQVLRTAFGQDQGSPFQVIAPASVPALPLIDLGALDDASRERELGNLAREESRRPFDLARGPVLRTALLRLAAAEHVLLLTLHHIASDGWSTGVLVREISALYGAARAGLPAPLPELPIQYADYAVWQRARFQGETLAAELAWWRDQLAGLPEVLSLPADRPRPKAPSFRGGRVPLVLDPATGPALAALAAQSGATLFMVLLAGFQAVLARVTGQHDFGVGTPVANRNRPELADLIGFFVNTLVLRADTDGDPAFAGLLDRVRQVTLAAYDHQELPFEKVVEELQPERGLGISPLFQAMFILQSAPLGPLALPELEIAVLPVDSGTAKFDLAVAFSGEGARLGGTLEYSADLFETATAARLAGHLAHLLGAATAHAATALSLLPLLAAAERHQILTEWNATAAALPVRCLQELVADQAARTPETVAVVSGDEHATYAELAARAARLARRLRGLGVAPEVVVGVCAERSLEMVVGILGILEAGGAYLPLDPSYPAERLAYQVADAGAPLVLAQERWCGCLAGVPAATRIEPLAVPETGDPSLGPSGVEPDNLAYVMYTSGSTGRPKGVMVPHRGVCNRLLWAHQAYRLGAADVLLQKAAFGFDFSVWELFAPLLAGARLVLARPDGHRDSGYLARVLAEQRVTLVHFVPSMLRAFLEEEGVERCDALRQVFAGGEALPPELRDRFFTRLAVPLDNEYGPTEISIDTTRWVCAPGQDPQRVPIGRPIANTRLHVVDRALCAVPLGVAGELLVGGPGVVRGYLGRPALTAERFVPDPWAVEPGARLYRTGDLARFLADGTLEFLGRIDQQVKIRGVRVEPGEIEALLAAQPGVRETVVTVHGEGELERRLVAYVVPAGPAGGDLRHDLRRALAERLPEPMLPSLFVFLETLPRTGTGKVDRRALPAPEQGRPAAAGFVPPRTPEEELLAEIWADVLGLDRVGAEDDFFALGGHSLLATRVVSRVRDALGGELPLRALFERPTVRALAAEVGALCRLGSAPAAPPLLPQPRAGDPPLSFAQERLWFLDQLAPGTPVYNIPLALRLCGSLRPDALAAVLATVVVRHEALRTSFAPGPAGPVQRIAPQGSWPLPLIDLAALPGLRREAELRRLAVAEELRPFDLARGPLVRGALVRLAAQEHAAFLTLHHIVCDGWSLGLLVREVAALYPTFAAGEPNPLAPLPVQYADFTLWQRSWLQGDPLAAQAAFWREALDGAPGVLELATDRPRPASPSGRGGTRTSRLSTELTSALTAFGRREGLTPFMGLLAAWSAVLFRTSGQTDLVIGVPIANRNRFETERLIGFFANTLALRTRPAAGIGYLDLARGVRETALRAYAHQDLPFARLVEELVPARSLAHTPLFQVMFALQNLPFGELALPGLALSPLELEQRTAKFDLSLFLGEAGDSLSATLEYSADLFDAPTADRLLGLFRTVLAGALADPRRSLADLPLLPDSERHQVLCEWNDAAAGTDSPCVHRLIEARSRQAPGAAAVLASDGTELSYGDLDRLADRLARRLRALGILPDDRVGICLERSWQGVVALLGVLKAGGCSVPLDPAYPQERLGAMLADAAVRVVVTGDRLAPALGAHAARILSLDGGWPPWDGGGELPDIGPDHLSYVIFTSGSTGRPKGVALPHRTLANLIAWQIGASAAPAGRTLQFASASFDVSQQEILATWAAGGALVLIAEEERADAGLLLCRLREARVERLFLPFVALQQLAEAAAGAVALPPLREVVTAGEQLLVTPEVRDLFARLPGCVLRNQYGPSEAHVVTEASLWHRQAGDVEGWPALPAIGRPIAGTRVHLLDPGGAPVPIGVPGEVYLGGAGLARGYLGRPDLTAERFVPDPWGRGERLYRTGDLARRRPAGEIEFLGRIDHQVKIRGFRVELGEIETTLAAHPAVREAVVVARGQGAAKRLVACVVPAEGSGELGEPLRAHLRERLPDYMIPASFVTVAGFPLTASGKVDRRALAAAEPEPRPEAAGGGSPRTPTEEVLAAIWAEVLELERVGIHDGFFDLGGHSLLATRVLSRLRGAFGVELPLRTLFERPSIAELAGHLDDLIHQARGLATPPLERAARRLGAPLPLSFAQQRLWFLDRLAPGTPWYNLAVALHLEGRLDAAALAASLGRIVGRHEALRTVYPAAAGEPWQHILPPMAVPLPVVDLSGLPEALARPELARRLAGERSFPFDLAAGPLLRATLLKLAGREHVLSLAVHHIAADGWSIGVFVRELSALYAAAVRGTAPLVPDLPVQYADYAVWQRGWLQGEALERLLAAWRTRLAGAPTILALPTDRPRPPVRSSRGTSLTVDLDPRVAQGLRALARARGATLFMALLAGFQTLLCRLSGQQDLLVGSPVAGRNRAETEGLIGVFVNTLVLRGDLTGRPGFGTVLDRTRDIALEAYALQDLPFERLVEEFQPERDLSRPALVQVLLALQNAPLSPLALPDLALRPLPTPGTTARFDLLLAFAEAGEGLAGALEVATDLFDRATARRWFGHLEALCESVVAEPERPVVDLPLLIPAERHQVVAEWNDTAVPFPGEMLVHQWFEAQADRAPTAVAAVWRGLALTYGELEARANRIAALLRGLGAGRGTSVGVWMERSLDMVAAVLGVLKAGGHYLPLDPSWPAERVEAILAASAVPAVLTRAAHLGPLLELRWRLPSLGDVICLDVEAPAPPAERVDDAAVRAVFDLVAERAVDRETAGGFVSSFTGEPFSVAEVDEYRDRVLALAEPWLGPDKRVLEIGSGSGLLLWEIAPRVARCVGLDPSPLTQERNRAEAARRGLRQVELPVGFAHETGSWPAGAFDLVLVASTAQFFPGPLYLEQVVAEALRLLAPGGALVLADVPDARRRAELRREVEAHRAARGLPRRQDPHKILHLDEDLFRDLAAVLPEAGEVSVLHRETGFANELRFRYDVVLTRGAIGAGGAAADARQGGRRKRLWTSWHVERADARRPPAVAAPEDLAYVIHTSGSTGQPKGIMVQHRPVANLIAWINRACGIGPDDRVLFVTSLCFDLSVWDLFGLLAAGGSIHIATEEDLRDPEQLVRTLLDEPITVWDSAPAALVRLAPLFPARPAAHLSAVPHSGGTHLRRVLLSGDWIPVTLPDRVRAAFPAAEVLSLGGATEATVWSNSYPVRAVDPAWPSIPYGRPMPNAWYLVLDAALLPCPAGVPGDLYIGGDCLCVGYAHQPALTAAAFVPDPFSGRPGARLYCTGDRARSFADGNLEFLGRLDFQVKVRGFRIELGEIEAALAGHPAVRQAVVAARAVQGEERRLVAWITSAGETPATVTELRAHLASRLPDYMVPGHFVHLAELPLTASGKVDRRALPDPTDDRPELGAAYVPPGTALETSLAGIWRRTLGIDRVGVHDNFFDLGGHSMSLMRVHALLREELGAHLPVLELFERPTIKALAERLGAARGAEAPASALERRAEPLAQGKERMRQRLARRA